jgi:hypothetical protein
MATSQGTAALARLGVELTVRMLPTWQHRLRYRAEFLAELPDLSPADQLRYAAGVLSQTFALRAALGAAPTRVEENAMTVTSGKRFRCRYLRWHDWQTFRNPDGERYRACSVCDREEPRVADLVFFG